MKWVKNAVGYWCEDILDRKYLGQKIGVAVLDTGILPHPDLAGRIMGFGDFVNRRKRIYDDSGHGTHVAGILAGSGKLSNGVYAGIAPEASLLAAKVLDDSGNGMVEYVMEGSAGCWQSGRNTISGSSIFPWEPSRGLTRRRKSGF